MINTTQALIQEINNQLQECLNRFDDTLIKEKAHVEEELEILKQYQEKVQNINSKIKHSELPEDLVNQAKELVNQVSLYTVDLDEE